MNIPMLKTDIEDPDFRPDFCLVTGDAFVDHPSFGAAIIARTLESKGYTVAVIAQPDWTNLSDFKRFGRPRLGFLVTAGNMDSMVNHYTSSKKPRSNDAYTPGNKPGKRPDMATIVYVNKIRESYKNIAIIIGGIEASLRRFAHYDYWTDSVRRSILVDSGADLLVYGMGEKQIIEIADLLNSGLRAKEITYVKGTCYLVPADEGFNSEKFDGAILPSFEQVKSDKKAYADAFMEQLKNTEPLRGMALAQCHGKQWLLANPPPEPMNTRELDQIYALPYTRMPHPSYGHIPALDEVEFSITSSRGCFGGCNFCALTFHQGRAVQARSHDSILGEARAMVKNPRFKGNIHDVGGPTANFRIPSCSQQIKNGVCAHKQCLTPKCTNLQVSHKDYTALLIKLRELPGVKKVFIRSGLRYDYILYDKENDFLQELCEHHVSGQLKIAPEHVNENVLHYMGKPKVEIYERFLQKYEAVNKKIGKQQYVVPYFMSSHPGSDLHSAIELACYLKEKNQRVEQVQDFYPTPGTLSTCMFYTGIDPRDGKPVYVPRTPQEKAMQRALLQYYRKENAAMCRKALKTAQRDDLIGNAKKCLVQDVIQSQPQRRQPQRPQKARKPLPQRPRKKK